MNASNVLPTLTSSSLECAPLDENIDNTLIRSNLQKCLLDNNGFFNELLDNPEGVNWFSLATTMTQDFAQQIHDLIKKNNQNSEKKSMIERTVRALMEPKHRSYIFTYQWKVLGVIMLWKQDEKNSFMGQTVYQRWTLIVDWVNNLWIAKELITLANNNAFEYVTEIDNNGHSCEKKTWFKVYWVASGNTVIKHNLESHQKILAIEKIESTYFPLYLYLQWVRGGDFRNLAEDETISQYYLIFNDEFASGIIDKPQFQLKKQDTLLLLQHLMLNNTSMATIYSEAIQDSQNYTK